MDNRHTENRKVEKKRRKRLSIRDKALIIFLFFVLVFIVFIKDKQNGGTSSAVVIVINNRLVGESINQVECFGPIMNSGSKDNWPAMRVSSGLYEIDGRKYNGLDFWLIDDESNQEKPEISLRVGQECVDIPLIDVTLVSEYNVELRFEGPDRSRLKDINANKEIEPPYIIEPGNYRLQWSK